MWELEHREGWAPKNWCFWTVVLEKTLESSLDSKEIQPVHPKGNQPWIFIGRTDAEAEAPILWPPDAKSWLTGIDRWCWERLTARGEGDSRGWDGWMASLSWWTWVWVSSRSWWWTGKPGMLQSIGSQRVGHDWATELTDTGKGHCNLMIVYKRRLYTWTSPDGQHQNQIDYILCSQRWRNSIESTKNKNKTRSWLWLRSWTPDYQIQTSIEESRENH